MHYPRDSAETPKEVVSPKRLGESKESERESTPGTIYLPDWPDLQQNQVCRRSARVMAGKVIAKVRSVESQGP